MTFRFPTTIHNFAQPSPPNFIDAKNRFHYLAHQIGPKSWKALGLSFEGAAA